MADKYLKLVNGVPVEVVAISQNGTSSDDGKLVALLPTGKISSTLLPDAGSGAASFSFSEPNLVGLEIFS